MSDDSKDQVGAPQATPDGADVVSTVPEINPDPDDTLHAIRGGGEPIEPKDTVRLTEEE